MDHGPIEKPRASIFPLSCFVQPAQNCFYQNSTRSIKEASKGTAFLQAAGTTYLAVC